MENAPHTFSLRRPEIRLDAEVVRELTEADLLVRETLGAGSTLPTIKALRATHHKLAQCLAAFNMSEAEASVSTGYSPSRISILKKDPSFIELLAFYSTQKQDIFVDVTQRMAGVATDTLEVIQERLQDNPESFKAKDLVEVLKATADRGGHSPVRKSETKSITITASDLLKMKEEVNQKQYGQIRKINQAEEVERFKANESSLQEADAGVQDNFQPTRGANDNGAPCVPISPEEAPGSACEGNDLRTPCGAGTEEPKV